MLVLRCLGEIYGLGSASVRSLATVVLWRRHHVPQACVRLGIDRVGSRNCFRSDSHASRRLLGRLSTRLWRLRLQWRRLWPLWRLRLQLRRLWLLRGLRLVLRRLRLLWRAILRLLRCHARECGAGVLCTHLPQVHVCAVHLRQPHARPKLVSRPQLHERLNRKTNRSVDSIHAAVFFARPSRLRSVGAFRRDSAPRRTRKDSCGSSGIWRRGSAIRPISRTSSSGRRPN